MRIAFLADTHFGARGDSKAFSDHFKKFFDKQFFPFVDEHKVEAIIHLGDLVDRRKYVNYVTVQTIRDSFINPINKRRIPTYVMAGNHDAYYRNTLAVNAVREILGPHESFYVIDHPFFLNLDDWRAVMIPWICEENYSTCMGAVDAARQDGVKTVLGHLELKGFEVNAGQVMETGMDASLFDGFEWVASGHYHHPSRQGRVHYLGAPYEMNWGDAGGVRGFHYVDTEIHKPGETLFVQNEDTMHVKLFYDDVGKTPEEVFSVDPADLAGKIVKVVTVGCENPYWLDRYVESLDAKANGVALQVVEDHLNADAVSAKASVDTVVDTMAIVDECVAEVPGVDRARLNALMRDLYDEATREKD